MTYAGLKSMIYAGLSHDDPRVKAAWDWITKNFTVDENPGMAALGPDSAQGGLYYYFYTMARCDAPTASRLLLIRRERSVIGVMR